MQCIIPKYESYTNSMFRVKANKYIFLTHCKLQLTKSFAFFCEGMGISFSIKATSKCRLSLLVYYDEKKMFYLWLGENVLCYFPIILHQNHSL